MCTRQSSQVVIFFLLLVSYNSLSYAKTHHITANLSYAEKIQQPLITPIYLEHATTKQEILWGLMQRDSLVENTGMSFNFSSSKKRIFWSFNCLIDLSVAFLDEKKIIRSIGDLHAFPHMMDPKRPVKSPSNFLLYSLKDPIIIFFAKKALNPQIPFKYALEMPLGWFQSNHVNINDLIYWTVEKEKGYISHTIDLSSIKIHEKNPHVLIFPGNFLQALCLSTTDTKYQLIYLDHNFKAVKIDTLKGSAGKKTHEYMVSSSEKASKYVLIRSFEHSQKSSISLGDYIFFKAINRP